MKLISTSFLLILIQQTIAQDFFFPDNEIFNPPTYRQEPLPSMPSNNIPPFASNANSGNNNFRPLPPSSPAIFPDPLPPISNEVLPINARPSVIYNGNNGLGNVISNGITSLELKLNNELQIGHERTIFTEDRPVVFSPVNIAEALSLVMLGATGRTFTEIAQILGLYSTTDISRNSQNIHEQFGRMLSNFEQAGNANPDSPKLVAASAVFVQDGFPIRNEYRQIATNVYKSEIQNLDFQQKGVAAKNFINNWVASKTNGKITNILSAPPPQNTRVLLTTALYFKGAWETPFIQDATQRRPFYPYGRQNKTTVSVDMMANFGQYQYFKDRVLNCEIVALPYKGGTTSMYIIVPLLSNKDKLQTLEKQLTPENIDRLIKSTRKRDALVLMPKMRLESTLQLSRSLIDLGVSSLFNAQEANLGVLSPGDSGPKIANRFDLYNNGNFKSNCSNIFEIRNNYLTNCTDFLPVPINNRTKVIYKRFGNQVGRRFARHYNINSYGRFKRQSPASSIDDIRHSIENGQYSENPQLYADEILHKVFIDITETGTEAAAATDVTISRSGLLTLRLDHPFLFFIRHNETKLDLFWGSVTVPTPYY